MRWVKGARDGSVIVGGNGVGGQSNQLWVPVGLSFDRHGNLYVADDGNHRVQKFNIDSNA
jgi:DNA-binding beta-propeller fold protein YncE